MKTLITGDFILDKHILKGNRSSTSSPREDAGSKIDVRKGGAFLTFELLQGTMEAYKKTLPDKKADLTKKISTESDKEQKAEYEDLRESVEKEIEAFRNFFPDTDIYNNLNTKTFTEFSENHPEYISYIMWEGQPGKAKLSFKPMGYGPPGNNQKAEPEYLPLEYKSQELLIIDEANLSFRYKDVNFKNKTIFYKMAYPLCNGTVWQNLIHNTESASGKDQKLITIVTLENLRRYNVKVSKAISWEQTALDLCYEITTHEILKQLLQSTCLIVLIGSAGALLIQKGNTEINSSFELIFDPVHMEDEWEAEHGTSVGSGSVFVAGMAFQFIRGLLLHENNPKQQHAYAADWCSLITTGLNHVRTLRRIGLFYKDEHDKIQAYPVQSLARATQESPCYYSKAFVPSPYHVYLNAANSESLLRNEAPVVEIGYLKNSTWSILEGNYFHTGARANPNRILSLARDISLLGPSAATYAPVLKYGKFVSLDRREIESLRNLKQLILNHYNNPDANRPLNIAIFGPPGAGKSYAVSQMAKTLFGKDKVEFLEYNLSQFDNPTELIGAYHSIRDAVLQGKFPFAFWDEFDSKNLEWLAHLIAPMQDGRFQDHGKLHPLGKCVFIFAGATSYKMEAFDPEFFDENAFSADSSKIKETQQFTMKKGPDFLSRIHGFLDVLGPNKKFNYRTDNKKPDPDPTDHFYPIRRALFLRSSLKLDDETRLDIDWGLLSALLEIDEYKKGSRSLERLLTQIHLMNKDCMVRSNLPSDEIIGINVDYDKFIGLLNKDRNMEQFSETAAVHIHNVWMKFKETSSTFYHEYNKLNLEGRWKNIASALRIKEVIGATERFTILPDSCGVQDASEAFREHIGTGQNPPPTPPPNKNLETLAITEHQYWCKESINEGWQPPPQGSGRNDYLKWHHCLVPYGDLKSENARDKDRGSVKHYVDFLKGSGYRIVEN